MSVESLWCGFASELGGPGKSSVPTVGSLYSRMVERLPLSPLVSYWGLRFLPQDVVWCSSGGRSSLRMEVSQDSFHFLPE
ncbi:hypothetical protein Bca4012_064920 [Brassica carinata]